MTTFDHGRLALALSHATMWHHRQVRKGTSVPYIAHPLRVCAIVLDDGGGADEACAAVLHDAVEDTPLDLKDVEHLFGPEVARIVRLCSDDEGTGTQKPPWRRRKETHFADLHHDPAFDHRAARVMAADKLANLTSMLDDADCKGPTSWDRFKGGIAGTLWYLETATGILSRTLDGRSRLPEQLAEGLVRLREIRDEEQIRLGGLDDRIAATLGGVTPPDVPGWSDEAVALASFEIARALHRGPADRTDAILTVLAGWFATPLEREDRAVRAEQVAGLSEGVFAGAVDAVLAVAP